MSALKVSVILPIYNPGSGISKCIDSLRRQLLDGLEFIFVDDCSTDGSMASVEQWARQDARVRILRNEDNLGPGPSRNRGIEAAKGEYLSFVDPDDYVSPEFYTLLYEAATSGDGHDIAKGLRITETGPLDRDPSGGIWWNRRILEKRPKHPLYAHFASDHFCALYRRDFVINHEAWYGSSRKSEDTTFLLRVCYHTEDIVIEPRAEYYYVQREGSIVHQLTSQVFQYEVDGFREKVDFLASEGFDKYAFKYLAEKLDYHLEKYRLALRYGSELHDGYCCYFHELLSLLEPQPGKKRILQSAPVAFRLYKNLLLTMPGLRPPGEGDVRVSVILPVYNVRPYIDRCVESLRWQLLDGLEFICVDDCSTDGSMAVLEAWAAEDDRVRIIRNEQNLGAGPSRNRGIEEARGDYLSFVDPDDYVSPDFYELLYAAAISSGGHDIAKGSCQKVDVNGNVTCSPSRLNDRIASALIRSKSLYTIFRYEHWSAIYHKRLFTSGVARYGASRNGQDVTFLLRTTTQTNDLVQARAATYYYVQRPGSAININGSERTANELNMYAEMIEFLSGSGIGSEERGYLLLRAQRIMESFVDLLDEGRVCRDEYQAVADRLAHLMKTIPGIGAFVEDDPLITDILYGSPLTTPGIRQPSEGDVRVSVILSVCNVGSSIRRCIESLRSQLLDGLEFIFVDDCSTDGSMAVLEAWAAEDDRVLIIRNEESLGVGPSLNRGIELAHGDYLAFADPDDYPSASFYLLLYAAAISDGGHDMAKGTREIAGLDRESSSELSKLANERILSALRKRIPLFTVFTSEHTTAIYKHSLFSRGACYGTTGRGADTTFLLSACLTSEDIVLANNAIYRCSVNMGVSSDPRQLEPCLGKFDSIIEKVAILWERPRDVYTKRYLEARLAECVTSYYVDCHGDPSRVNDLGNYAQELANTVGYLTTLGFLAGKSSCYNALIEHHALLPLVDSLPAKLKVEGSHDWMGFIKHATKENMGYSIACARAQEAALCHIALEQGLRAFKTAYSQTLNQVSKLPLETRVVILLELHRKLASRRNLRKALKKAEQWLRNERLDSIILAAPLHLDRVYSLIVEALG